MVGSFKISALAVVLMMSALDASCIAATAGGPDEPSLSTMAVVAGDSRDAPAPAFALDEKGPLSQAAPGKSTSTPILGEQGSEPAFVSVAAVEPASTSSPPVPGNRYPAPLRSGPDVAPSRIMFIGPDTAIDKYGAATVGRPTQFDVTVANFGTADAGPVGLRVTLTDYFRNVIGDWSTSIPTIAAQDSFTASWKYWTPSYSTVFSVNATVSAPGDANATNDTMVLTGLIVEKWLDSCDSTSGWSGDLGTGQWGLTAADPRPGGHSGPSAWHCGLDGYYLNDTDASLITPSLDLTRMNPNYYILFNANYYGSSVTGDQVETYVTDDGGTSWYPLFASLSGSGSADGWHSWVSHWQDYDGDRLVDPNEPHQDGLDLSKFCGRTVKVKFRFTSDASYNDIGFYLDDMVLRGWENLNDVALQAIRARALDRLEAEQTFSTVLANIGQNGQDPFKAYLNLSDGTSFSQNVAPMAPGEVRSLAWKWTPTLPGNYTVQCTLIPQKDEVPEDNSLWRPVHVAAGNASTLLVDDDSGPGNNGALRYLTGADVEWGVEEALTMAEYDYYLVGDEPGPPLEVMQGYGLVIWLTGYDDASTSRMGTLSAADRQDLGSYMDGGGRLWLISFETLWDTWVVQGNTSFATDHLRIKTFDEANDDDVGMPGPLDGVPEDPIADGLHFDTIVPPTGLWDKCDRLENASDSPGIFYQYNFVKDRLSGPFNALRYSGDFKLVFMAFELTFIRTPEDRATVTSRVLDWLWGGTALVAGDGGVSGSVAPGQKIVYNITLANSEQRSWTVESLGAGQVSPGWSATSTPAVVNGSPPVGLPPMGSVPIQLEVTAPAAAGAGSTGNVTLLARLSGSPSYISITTRTSVLPVAGVSLFCAEHVMNVSAGDEALFMVSVSNDGNFDNQVALALKGEAAAWCQLSRNALFLSGGGKAFVQVAANLPEAVLAGAHSLTVGATMPNGTGSLVSELGLTFSVNATHSLKIEGSPSSATLNMAEKLDAHISLNISNYGNVGELAVVSLCATFSGWQQWRLTSQSRPLLPFEKASSVDLEVGIPPSAPAGYYNLTVRLGFQSGDLADKRNTVINLQRPDLSVTADDLKTSPARPSLRDNMELTAVVHNAGNAQARNFAVVFTVNDKPAGTQRITDPIAPGLTSTALILYKGIVYGDNVVNVSIDPDGSLLEISKDNNVAGMHFTGYQADLAAGAVSLRAIGRAQPTGNRSVTEGMVEISVQVLSTGSYALDVDNVTVYFTVDALPVENRTVSVRANSAATATALWFAKKGGHTIKVTVDPGNRVDEVAEANNEASLTVKVQGTASEPASVTEWLPLAAGIVAILLVAGALAYQSYRARSDRGSSSGPESMRRFRAKPASDLRCAKCRKPIPEGSSYLKCGRDHRYHAGCAPWGVCGRCADGAKEAEEE